MGRFDRAVVIKQIRSLQVLETVNLMAGGYPHRMRFKAFIARFRVLAGRSLPRRIEDSLPDECATILHYLQTTFEKPSQVSTGWAVGKRHIFLR